MGSFNSQSYHLPLKMEEETTTDSDLVVQLRPLLMESNGLLVGQISCTAALFFFSPLPPPF